MRKSLGMHSENSGLPPIRNSYLALFLMTYEDF
jgi:hypothetical protein